MKINEIITENNSGKMDRTQMHNILDRMEVEGTLDQFNLKKHDVPEIVDIAQLLQGSTMKTSEQGEGAVWMAVKTLSAKRTASSEKQPDKSTSTNQYTGSNQRRSRRDRAGRNLKHDRYYNDNKKDGDDDNGFTLPEPVEKLVKKYTTARNRGERWAKTLSDLGKFDQKR